MKMKILTPNGFQPFEGVARYWHDKSLKFVFEDGNVESAYDHRFIINGKEVFARDVKIGDNIGKTVKDIIKISEGDYFYDPVNVSNGKIYNHDNGLISHNTFLGAGNTLISGASLLKMKASNPILIQRDTKYYEKPVAGHDYIMTVDVCKGRGQDYSTFSVIDITQRPFKQVATYRNNMISPILFPNIIHKVAKEYNDAYVIVESNDQGAVVCNGLFMDLEYENVHLDYNGRRTNIGVEMNKKVKRIGCSNFKDLIEEGKLEIVDEDTIIECSTFEAKGVSYEATDGNHDDLVMNFVMFGYYVGTNWFGNETEIDIKKMLFEQQEREIEEEMLPFGFSTTDLSGVTEVKETVVIDGELWTVEESAEIF